MDRNPRPTLTPAARRPARWLVTLALCLAAPSAFAVLCKSNGAGGGSWRTAATWDATSCTVSRPPAATDDVEIQTGDVVNLDSATNPTMNKLTANGTFNYNHAGNRNVVVTTDVIIGAAGKVQALSVGGTRTGTLTVGGDITNSNILDLVSAGDDVVNTTFNKAGAGITQTISGAGATTRFNRIVINMGTGSADVVDFTATNFSVVPTPFLTLTKGTFKLSAAASITPWTVNPNTPAASGFWLNHASATASSGNFAVTIRGLFKVSAGTFNLGTTAGNGLLPDAGSTIEITGGNLNVAGRITRQGAAEAWTFSMSGGTVTVCTVTPTPCSTSTTLAPFHIEAAQTFTMSGGTIVIQNPGNVGTVTSATNNLAYTNLATSNTVTGGTIQIGNASTEASRTFNVNSSAKIWDLTVNTTNSPTARLLTNAPTVLNTVTIDSGATLNANNVNMTVGDTAGGGGGNWTNNGTFTAGASTTQKLSFVGGAASAIAGSATTTFFNLTLDKSANDLTITTSPVVTGDLAFTNGYISAGSNLVTVGPVTRSGTITADGTTTVTGSGTAFTTELQIGNRLYRADGVTQLGTGTITAIASDTSLTLSATAAAYSGAYYNTSAGSTSSAGTGKYVKGCVKRNFNTSASQNFTFPIGDSGGSTYTPVVYALTGNSAKGDVTACTTNTDHPQVTANIASNVINPGTSVNRYWTLTQGTSGAPNGTYAATFTFVSGDRGELTDAQLDGSAANPVIIERYGSPNFFPTTIGTRTTTTTQAAGLANTQYGAFAIGVPLSEVTSKPGVFNAFENSADLAAVTGKINTRIAGATNLTLAVVILTTDRSALSATATDAKVWLVDASPGGTKSATTGCSPDWTFLGTSFTAVDHLKGGTSYGGLNSLPDPIATVTFDATPTVGRRTFTFDATPKTTPYAANPGANAYQDVRVLMQDVNSDANIACSTDRFVIRPKDLKVEAKDGGSWQANGVTRDLNNAATSGGAVHVASTGTTFPFTMKATARDNAGNTTTLYTGTPSLKLPTATNPQCVEPSGVCVTGTLALNGSFSFASGVGTVDATYSETGTFNVTYEDATYAANDSGVDSSLSAIYVDDDNPGYVIPQDSSNAPRLVGRFVPASFTLSTSTAPVFKTYDDICPATRSFTYIGQPFKYGTTPVVTITAKNAGAGTTTQNYTGSLWKIGSGSPSTAKNCLTNPDPSTCVFTNTWTGSKATQTYTASGAPNWDNALASAAAASVSGGSAGSGTLSMAASDQLGFTRSSTTPIVPFSASITNAVSVEDTSEGVTISSSAFSFSGISFDQGNDFRYGRLRLFNAVGSPLINLPVTLTAEYYDTSASGFVTNIADNCTTLAAGDFKFQNFGTAPTTLTATELPDSHVLIGAARVALGVGSLTVQKPTVGTVFGSANICLDLGTADATTCTVSPAPTSRDWLLGPWGAATYTKEPTARISFGVYGAQPRQFIFMRENY